MGQTLTKRFHFLLVLTSKQIWAFKLATLCYLCYQATHARQCSRPSEHSAVESLDLRGVEPEKPCFTVGE